MRAAVIVFLPLLAASCGSQLPEPQAPGQRISPAALAELHGPASAPVEPFRVVGDIYYVGAANIASYLITTPQGHILLDTGTREMTPVVTANITKLGFKLEDVKILLSGHAHFDHVQGHAAIQRATHAQVMALGDDAAALEAGQDRSPLGAEGWEPVHVDRVLHDGDVVTLGTASLTAHWIPGHTPGCTVWTTSVRDHDQPHAYEVAFYACAGPNDSVQLIGNRAFPDLVGQTLAGFAHLRKLRPDIWLLMHPGDQLTPKVRAAIAAGSQPHPLVDPGGWNQMLADSEREFRARVHDEQVERAHSARPSQQ